jgi:hypothetical protein
VNGVEYTMMQQKKFYYAYSTRIVATAGLDIFDYVSADTRPILNFNTGPAGHAGRPCLI